MKTDLNELMVYELCICIVLTCLLIFVLICICFYCIIYLRIHIISRHFMYCLCVYHYFSLFNIYLKKIKLLKYILYELLDIFKQAYAESSIKLPNCIGNTYRYRCDRAVVVMDTYT